MSAAAADATNGMLFRSSNGANLWVDDVRFSDTGITDEPVGPDTTAPSAPAAAYAADHPSDSGGSIDLSWAAATDDIAVTGYRLYRGTSPGVYGTPITLPTAATAFTDTTAVTGTRYYYAITALDAAGNEGARSPEASAVSADDVPPAAPSGLTATGETDQISLSWSANTEVDLAGYNLYRGGVKVNTAVLTSTSFIDTGRASGTTYTYTVKAVDTAGNESAASASASATTPGTPPADAFDGTFESGTDGASLAPAWTLHGTSQHAEYDTAQARNGSRSAWIQGAAPGNTGVIESASGAMSSSGAEYRFWAYFDATTGQRQVDDYVPGATTRTTSLVFASGGTINAYTTRAGNPNGYTTGAITRVGTYATGWTEFRIVYDFAGQTYTLSKRSAPNDAWTPLKAAGASTYDIPFMSAAAADATNGMLFRSSNGANLWVDDVRFSDTGITD